MKKMSILLIYLFTFQGLFAQIINENFGSGIPTNWTQFSNTGISWTSHSTLGTNMSGCAISDYGSSSISGDAWLQTPFVDISSLMAPELRFDFALVQNNFVSPTISLWYDIGAGWVQLNTWNTTTFGFDQSPPLDPINVNYESQIYSLSSVAGNSNIRFAFGSDYVNGGYVLIDNVIVQETPPPGLYTFPYLQDFESTPFLPIDWGFFGGNNLASWQHHSGIGAYGLSNWCIYFDNFSSNLTGNYYGVRSVNLDMSNTVNPHLTFDIAYAKRDSNTTDRLGIWYSLNGTTGWTNLVNYDHEELATTTNQNNYFTPASNHWDSITIDLSQFNGTPLIRFAFENNCNFGNVIYLDNVHFYELDTTTIKDPNSISQPSTSIKSFQVFVNSHSRELHISGKKEYNTIESYAITNLSGQRVFDNKFTKEKINISELKKGVFFVTIKTNQNKFFTKKILIP